MTKPKIALVMAAYALTMFLYIAHPVKSVETMRECPPDTSDGSYFVRGYDPTTGEAICAMSFFDACPYADNVSASDPTCLKLGNDKQAPSEPKVAQEQPEQAETTPKVEEYAEKSHKTPEISPIQQNNTLEGCANHAR